MMFEMCAHISQANDLGTEMAFRCSRSISEFMGGETRDQHFGGWVEGITFLWDFEVAKLTQNDLAGTNGSSMSRQISEI
jgi:hypothetical protein